MRNLIIGILIGLALGGSIAWASMSRITLVDQNEAAVGVTGNPLYVQGV